MSLQWLAFCLNITSCHYYASQAQFCHTSNGLPHINPGELSCLEGIAQGITTLGLNSQELAATLWRFVGTFMNFIGGWVTDFTTAFKQSSGLPQKQWKQRQNKEEVRK